MLHVSEQSAEREFQNKANGFANIVIGTIFAFSPLVRGALAELFRIGGLVMIMDGFGDLVTGRRHLIMRDVADYVRHLFGIEKERP